MPALAGIISIAFSIGIAATLAIFMPLSANRLVFFQGALTLLPATIGATLLLGCFWGRYPKLVSQFPLLSYFSTNLFLALIFLFVLSFVPLPAIRSFTLIALAGFAIVLMFLALVREKSKTKIIFFVLLAMVVGFAVLIKIFSGNYISPFYTERIAVTGFHLDQFMHTAISNMQILHGTASVGLDGLVHFRQYVLGEEIIARASVLVSMPGFDFYNIGYPIYFTSLWQLSLAALLIDLKALSSTESNVKERALELRPLMFSLLMILPLVFGVMPDFMYKKYSIAAANYIFSETYLISLIIFGFLLFLWIFYLRVECKVRTEGGKILLIFLMSALCLLLLLTKFQVGVVSSALSMWLLIRNKPSHKQILLMTCAVIVFSITIFVKFGALFQEAQLLGTGALTHDAEVTRWFYFPASYFSGDLFPLLPIFFYLISFIFIFFRLKQESIIDFQSFKSRLLARRIIDIELLILAQGVVIIALAWRWTLHLSVTSYFLDFPAYFSILLLVSLLSSTRIFRVVGFAALILSIPIAITFIGYQVGNMAQVFRASSVILLQTQRQIKNFDFVQPTISCPNPTLETGLLFRVFQSYRDFDCSIVNFREYIDSAKNAEVHFLDRINAEDQETAPPQQRLAKLVDTLSQFASWDKASRKRSIILIDPSLDFYWRAFDSWPVRQLCDPGPFIVPAIAGIPLLSGVKGVSCWEGAFGLAPYYDNLKNGQPAAPSPCVLAMEKGFNQIIYIKNARDWQLISCNK